MMIGLRLRLTDSYVLHSHIECSTMLITAPPDTFCTFHTLQLVEFGAETLRVVPGRVSTEVDPRLSFDKEGTKRKVRRSFHQYFRE